MAGFVGLQAHPQVVFALAPALSRSVATASVPSSVAQTILALFPGADYISLQVPALSGSLLSLNWAVEGPPTSELLCASSSLAGTAYANRASLSAFSARPGGCRLTDVDRACSQWRSTHHLCIPLLVDSQLTILEASLRADVLDTGDQQGALSFITEQYAVLAASAPCLGTMTIGTRDEHLFCNGAMANLCMIGSVTAMQLATDLPELLSGQSSPALVEQHGLLADPAAACSQDTAADQVPGTRVGAVNESPRSPLGAAEPEASACTSAGQAAEGRGSGSDAASLTAAPSSAVDHAVALGAGCSSDAGGDQGVEAEPSSSCSEHVNARELVCQESNCCSGAKASNSSEAMLLAEDTSQHPLLLHFRSSKLERDYVLWLAQSYLAMQRVLNLIMGVPWLLLAGFTEPWLLRVHAPKVWCIMSVYVTSVTYLLWRLPLMYMQHFHAVVTVSWAFTAWFFPWGAGHIPIETLPLETLMTIPWLPFSVGCLTNVVVPLCYMARFKWFVVRVSGGVVAGQREAHDCAVRAPAGWPAMVADHFRLGARHVRGAGRVPGVRDRLPLPDRLPVQSHAEQQAG